MQNVFVRELQRLENLLHADANRTQTDAKRTQHWRQKDAKQAEKGPLQRHSFCGSCINAIFIFYAAVTTAGK